jgi:uncharacterized caspase-like protein
MMLILGLFVEPAIASEKRIALVIGVAAYTSVVPLKNTVNDSQLIARTLESLDFQVTKLRDAGREQMRQSLEEFAFAAETADVALVYFAGHGMEVGGKNFLIPADLIANDRSDAANGAVSLDEVLAAVDKARQLRVVILDSCRDDPFAREGANEIIALDSRPRAGLATPSPERGTLVAFAAEDGQVALDGAGENSPFTLALAEHLGAEDLEIGLVFRRVRDAVLRQTGNRQEPHTYGSLSGNPYFLAGQSSGINQLQKEDRRLAWASMDVDQEEQLSALAKDGDTRALKGLAYMRLDPNESRRDPAAAARLLTKAADAGDPEAMFELARLHEQGVGVDQDTRKALEYYQRSADAGFADAINDLGFLYYQGGLGIARDARKGLRYFEQAAELRHPEAMFNFAALIDDGIVEGRGPADSAKFLYEALRSGNERVLNQLSEDPAMFKETTRAELQRLLLEVEFYDGSIDGKFGPQTRRSLRKAYGIEE